MCDAEMEDVKKWNKGFRGAILEEAIKCLAFVELNIRNRDIRESVDELPDEEILGLLEFAAGKVKSKWSSYRKSISRQARRKVA